MRLSLLCGLFVAIAASPGCDIGRRSQECGFGVSCPPDKVCDPVSQTCVFPSQRSACEGQLEGAPCDIGAGVVGVCESGTCVVNPFCGDGARDPGEECDCGRDEPGNSACRGANSSLPDADCRPDCTISRCGDGVVDPGSGEQCDDGNTVDGDGCSAACASDTCGNGTVDALEECDDENTVDGDGCSATCRFETLPASCAEINSNNDGLYWIDLDGVGGNPKIEIYCADMSDASPVAYLPLLFVGEFSNFSFHEDQLNFLSATCYYPRVRIDLPSLVVDGSDQRFAICVGQALHSEAAWGRASACCEGPCRAGRFNIDVGGTGLMVAPTTRFGLTGVTADGTILQNIQNEIIEGNGGDEAGCGGLEATTPPGLQLTFAPTGGGN